jgi:hypothetical protein
VARPPVANGAHRGFFVSVLGSFVEFSAFPMRINGERRFFGERK